ncbi:MAG: transketolase [Flavobacteriaceae bacterium]|nr:transketolase [Flavobacteriaceae bacterium]
MIAKKNLISKEELSFLKFKEEILKDYRTAVLSRECSLLGRREVLTGKAKFGIFGDGKEVPQLAMARAFKNGDFRSGYYRDQTFMMAIGKLTPAQFFAGLYAHTSLEAEPMSGGRQMGGHFSTHSLNADGSWKELKNQKNSSSDISPTAGQMPRLLGLAQASKMYRDEKYLQNENIFSDKGNEVAWGTIGNASTSEGLFFETINAAGVMQVPMVISVWDDEYGISVHAKDHTTKQNISEILKGFQRNNKEKGYEILRVKGWDYTELIKTYEKAGKIAREEHVPVLIHVNELTQPQGHSTSGSHERYKGPERLTWEKEHDCLVKMRDWMINFSVPTNKKLKLVEDEQSLIDMEKSIKKEVSEAKREAWKSFLTPLKKEQSELIEILEQVISESDNKIDINSYFTKIKGEKEPLRKDLISVARKVLPIIAGENFPSKTILQAWVKKIFKQTQPLYSDNLYNESSSKVTKIQAVAPVYSREANMVDARLVLRDNFDSLFTKYPEALIFGEDAGKIGDVNQGLDGLQDKFGALRIGDTGIREATILGQGIGMAMRGLRPIAEIQYLDYLLYALQIMSDDLATLRYRTAGTQKAPLIIRTRGHRLEGIWHSGSPMGMIINALKGIYVLVPRNMTKAAGFYNTLMLGDEPALIIENLNGYRLKENLPTNLGEFREAIGVVETVKEGKDMTVVSYGSTLRIVEQVSIDLLKVGIDIEIIDAQCLLPFDINNDTVESVKKTNRLLVIDEDVPGGASAYLMQNILENQNAYIHLDSKPETLTAKAHRAAYGSDGDYFSKPSAEDIFEKIYGIMNEVNPSKYPELY